MKEQERERNKVRAREWKIRTNYYPKLRQLKKDRRRKVIEFYSNGNMCCECCGEDTFEFLAIDHKDGGGNKHRMQIHGKHVGGHTTIDWIFKNNFPPLFQVLCHNCNMAKGFWKVCPHKLKT